MKKVKIMLPLLGLSCLVMTSCKKDVADNITDAESRVYVTKRDSTVNFANYQTFRIADSVSVIKNGKFTKHDFTDYDSTMIKTLSQAMQQRGFMLAADKSTRTDVAIQVSRVYLDYTGIINYGNYRTSYSAYWEPYYWGYGGYGYYFPYSFDTYTIREGALEIDMIDLRSPDSTTKQLHSIWTGIGRGAGIFNTSNVNEEVTTLFNQSPYIQK